MKKQLDIKKLLILNLPYLLMGLFATNFGEAWRMAQGADASAKMLSFFSTLPVALASWWPSLHPLDLLVGLCCGAGLRLAVYLKSKNAKKYRHGMEYGSARWGTHEDIAPYVDPVFQNNVILTKTESLTMNSRPKDPKTARNKNVLVIGGSGSGKTRFWLKPNLMQMHSSYVVTDPKGTILVECGKMLQRGTPKMRPKRGKDHQPVKDRHGNPVYLQYERLQELNMIHFDCWASRFGETVTALELAPEGTGYRARTRFSKFFNLPELMNLFKEVADIKTADQLNLPTPEVEYHNIVAQPTEHQQEMVKALSERASLVHSGTVDPSQDNMLKITSDGRKLGLDQRIVNQMLPDEPGTKVNQCVDNIMQIWRDGKADKLTQLVFCDISTPQAKAPASKAAKTLDNPLLHALEGTVPLPEQEPAFTVYDDIRQKLIAQGMPADQIAFIHEANTEVRKKELFSKVRTGQVRVLLGSTAKMGAGTNVQDRLVALHDLDCPWRPGDLAQRKGRIERQGNQNPLVHVYRYVTEGTFDAYLWQTVENKQKFISQIMTSKSPVRSCDDVDETALSFAEIKALCAGDPRIKERMDLDVEVSRLKLMKADHQSKQYRLEDQLLKYFPEEIEKHKGFIKGFESDLEVLAAHPHPEDGFAGMEIRGDLLTDKENAGAALLDACKEVKTSDPVQIGSYRGYAMSVEFSAWKQEYTLLLKGQMTHRATLGTDPRGNLTRIDNALAQMPQRLESAKAQLDNLCQQQAAAKEEVGKPFLYEEELRSKNARLVELDTLLNIDGKGQAHAEAVVAKSTRTSVLDSLKRPVTPRSTDKKPKQHEEVR